MLAPKIPEILDQFGLEYTDKSNSVVMPCPIHGGDKENGFSIMKSGVGVWQCFTKQCHVQYKYPTLLVLIQALLNAKSITEAANWGAKFLHIDEKELESISARRPELDFMYLHKYISKRIDKPSMFLIRTNFIKDLRIPSTYFLNRGYSEKILDKFDIGDCYNPEDFQKFNRAIVPCYDEMHKYIVGYHGRSIFEKCIKCGKYHSGTCPITSENVAKCEKWKMSKGFNADSYLYNEWNFYDGYDFIILVEGAGDVWKLEEAGIVNSMALFGTKFTEQQRLILEAYPITKLIVATDNDEAGIKAKNTITTKCQKSFTIKSISPNKKDWGEMSIDEIKKSFEGVMK